MFLVHPYKCAICFFLCVCSLPLLAPFIQDLFALIPLFKVKVLSK